MIRRLAASLSQGHYSKFEKTEKNSFNILVLSCSLNRKQYSTEKLKITHYFVTCTYKTYELGIYNGENCDTIISLVEKSRI